MNPTTSKTKCAEESSAMSSLRTKLKTAEPEIRNYVAALEKENLKLQRHIAKLQAENMSANNRIRLFQEKEKVPQIPININL